MRQSLFRFCTTLAEHLDQVTSPLVPREADMTKPFLEQPTIQDIINNITILFPASAAGACCLYPQTGESSLQIGQVRYGPGYASVSSASLSPGELKILRFFTGLVLVWSCLANCLPHFFGKSPVI